MYRTITIGLITIILAGYFLFAMKREVELLNFEIKTVRQQINYEKNTINLLKAEFCHLSSPTRLSKLSKQYLSLANLTPERMVSDPLKEQIMAKNTEEIPHDIGDPKHPTHAKLVKWRYKTHPSKTRYVRHASLNSGISTR